MLCFRTCVKNSVTRKKTRQPFLFVWLDLLTTRPKSTVGRWLYKTRWRWTFCFLIVAKPNRKGWLEFLPSLNRVGECLWGNKIIFIGTHAVSFFYDLQNLSFFVKFPKPCPHLPITGKCLLMGPQRQREIYWLPQLQKCSWCNCFQNVSYIKRFKALHAWKFMKIC